MKFPKMRDEIPPQPPMEPPPIGPIGGVLKVVSTPSFHGHVKYHTFPNHQGN
jgi:hypothetical protein